MPPPSPSPTQVVEHTQSHPGLGVVVGIVMVVLFSYAAYKLLTRGTN